MGEQIEFPKNFKMYMLKAVECIHTGEMYDALELLKKAYEIKQDRTVNMLYTSTLVQTGKYKKALEIAEEMVDFYKKDDKRYLLYVSILLKNHQFLQAELIIQRKLKETYSPFHKEWQNAERLLEHEREQEALIRKNEQKTLIKKLYALADLPLEGQLYTVEQAEQLEFDTLKRVAVVIFGNPFVHTLAKSAFLQFLIKFNDESVYTFEWFDEVRQVSPKDLKLFDENEVVQNVRNQLEEKLGQNPSLKEMIQPEVEFHLMKLYPFIEEIVTDPQKWVILYIRLFEVGEMDPNEKINFLDEESEKMYEWIQKMMNVPY